MMYCEKVFKELHNYISATIDLESVLLTSIAIYSDWQDALSVHVAGSPLHSTASETA